jgi:general nucleoside transport system ATP-binding protein
VTGQVDPRTETNAGLSRRMIGREPPHLSRAEREVGAVVLEVRHLNLPKADPFGVSLEDIQLDVHGGEIVGIAGISGNGQPELMAALSGEDTRAPAGSIALFGADMARASPRVRRNAGMHFVPEERLGRGAVPSLTLAQNTLLTRTAAVSRWGLLRLSRVVRLASELIEKFRVKAKGPEAPAKSLSGGNLQKFIMGREIDAAPRLLVVSQPTWGVDVGAAADIRKELLRLRDGGAGVLVVSEELDELVEIADRMVVIARGRLSPSIPTPQVTTEQIGTWMSGLWPDAERAAHQEHHA